MTAAWAIALLILAPLAAAALAFAFPRRGRWLALATAVVSGFAIVQLTRAGAHGRRASPPGRRLGRALGH